MKRVLLSQRVDIIESYNERRDALDQKWARFLWEAGIVGIPVFNHGPSLAEILKTLPIDGIILSGGNNPVQYGGGAPERDNSDSTLIAFAQANNLPLLGVCRGMQSVVLHFGGSLREVKGHVATRHVLSTNREVNSYHGFAPDSIGSELTVEAQSTDGVIEYVKHKSLQIAGIMWHPERETKFAKEDIDLFRLFLCGMREKT